MSAHRLGHLNNWLPFSMVDGPGNRFVLFVQGCNFNCVACHNPYTIQDCNGCGVCLDACPEDALSFGSRIKLEVSEAACTNCEICVQVCPRDSTPLSSFVTVAQMLDKIRAVAPFISGVTVSGGEVTQQPQFVYDLFLAIKGDPELSHLTTFVDSNGSASRATWDLLAPVTDGAMIDLKALDPQLHLELTGNPNEAVLESIRYLAEIGLLYEVRLLIAAGINDDQEDVQDTIRWLRSVGPNIRIKLMGFRSHGTRAQAAHLVEPKLEAMSALGDRFRSAGFSQITVI